MSLVVKSLRGNALVWYHSLKRSNINTSIWMDFKRVFITSYVSEKTSPSYVVDLTDLKQGQDEKVLDFYTRVTTAIDDLESLVPSGHFDLPTPAFPRALTSVSAFVALNSKNKRNAAIRLVKHGASAAFSFLGLNIFLNGVVAQIKVLFLLASVIV